MHHILFYELWYSLTSCPGFCYLIKFFCKTAAQIKLDQTAMPRLIQRGPSRVLNTPHYHSVCTTAPTHESNFSKISTVKQHETNLPSAFHQREEQRRGRKGFRDEGLLGFVHCWLNYELSEVALHLIQSQSQPPFFVIHNSIHT